MSIQNTRQRHPLLSDPTRQTKITFSPLTPITSQEEPTLLTSHLACPGPVNRTNSRTIFQWATSSDVTRHKRANVTWPASTQRRRVGVFSIHDSWRAPRKRNTKKSIMEVTSSLPKISCSAWRYPRRKSSSVNSRQYRNCRPSMRFSFKTRNNDALPPWHDRGNWQEGTLSITRDSPTNSAVGTRWPADSTRIHTENKASSSQVWTKHSWVAAFSMKKTLYFRKDEIRETSNRNTRGNRAWQIND